MFQLEINVVCILIPQVLQQGFINIMTCLHAFQIQAEEVMHMNRKSFKMELIPLYYYYIYEKSVEIRGSHL